MGLVSSFLNFENHCRMIHANGKNLMTVGPKSYLAEFRCEFGNDGYVSIGNYCSIAHDITFLIGLNHNYRAVTSYQSFLIGKSTYSPEDTRTDYESDYNWHDFQIIIGNDVWIGRGATIHGGVVIGNGAVIAANSLVVKDVPPYAIVGGNPARVIRYRFDAEVIEKLNRIKWWYWPEEKIVQHKGLLNDVVAFVERFYVPEKRGQGDVARALGELRENGHRIFYFMPDFDAVEPLWERILQQYLKKYTAADQTILLLEAKRMDPAFQEKIYAQIHSCGEDAPLVVEYSSEQSLPLDILQNIDYFIAGKDYQSIQCCDYGQDYGVKILFGINAVVFP